MSKATKLRKKALKNPLSEMLKDKLDSKPQAIKKVEETTLSNGQKGIRLTFDVFN